MEENINNSPALEQENKEKQWYIVTTYSGNEQKVKDNIERRKISMNLENYVFRVIVAEEKIQEMDKNGKPKITKNKETGVEEPKYKIKNLYPGYVFVEMIMTDESWFMIRNTPRVTGIAGSSGGGQKPTPVTGKEIETVLKRMGMVDNSMYDRYHEGDRVKVIHGTFEGIDGAISRIDKENGKVVVDAIFFGRQTPIELDFSEIVRI